MISGDITTAHSPVGWEVGGLVCIYYLGDCPLKRDDGLAKTSPNESTTFFKKSPRTRNSLALLTLAIIGAAGWWNHIYS